VIFCTCFAISARAIRGSSFSIDSRFASLPSTNFRVSLSRSLSVRGSRLASFSLEVAVFRFQFLELRAEKRRELHAGNRLRAVTDLPFDLPQTPAGRGRLAASLANRLHQQLLESRKCVRDHVRVQHLGLQAGQQLRLEWTACATT
jgi:hypothetical protein